MDRKIDLQDVDKFIEECGEGDGSRLVQYDEMPGGERKWFSFRKALLDGRLSLSGQRLVVNDRRAD